MKIDDREHNLVRNAVTAVLLSSVLVGCSSIPEVGTPAFSQYKKEQARRATGRGDGGDARLVYGASSRR